MITKLPIDNTTTLFALEVPDEVDAQPNTVHIILRNLAKDLRSHGVDVQYEELHKGSKTFILKLDNNSLNMTTPDDTYMGSRDF